MMRTQTFYWIHVLPLLAFAAPSAHDWATLNATVKGRLLQSAPFSRSCFKLSDATTGSFNSSACTSIQQNYLVSTFRVGNAGSYEGLPWEGCPAKDQNCFLDTNDPADTAAFAPPQVCHQGGVPSYFIDVHEPADAQAAFKFAAKTGVDLVIKNTGHEYQGRSARPGSLALWTNNRKDITYNPSFKPTGCSSAVPRPVVTLAPGVEFHDLFAFGEANNLTIPGGGCGTVGASGGYAMGGGHSALSNTYGLAVDRVVEYRVVVPTGQYLIANECQNTDLYFALRGGGGGTFGFVTELVTLAFPRTPVHAFAVTNLPTDSATIAGFFSVLVNNTLHWTSSGWGGYASPAGMTYLNPTSISNATANSDMAQMRAFAASVNATVIETVLPSFAVWFSIFANKLFQESGVLLTIGSRLLPTNLFKTASGRSQVLNSVLASYQGHGLAFWFAVAPHLFDDDGSTSTTPAWRDSLVLIEIADVWNWNTTVAQQAALLEGITTSVDILRNITPSSGTYFGESDLHEPNFEASFWGANYPKLLAIKKKYDPAHILDCWHCVGWKGQQDSNYQCYL